MRQAIGICVRRISFQGGAFCEDCNHRRDLGWRDTVLLASDGVMVEETANSITRREVWRRDYRHSLQIKAIA
ncbi:hypothetical protein ACVWZK_008398 [Bradyrhizobium sp. GM0.4]